MRVTPNSYSESLVNHLQMLSRRQSTLQTQIATGQRVTHASDDPIAAQNILGLRDDAVSATQYKKNIEMHREFATVTGSALQSLQRVLDRAQEIAFSVDDLDSPEALRAYGIEIGELLKQSVAIANTSHRGEYIFSGTRIDIPAVTETQDSSNLVVSVSFGGNASRAESEVAPLLDGDGHAVPSRAWERVSREAGVVKGDHWEERLGRNSWSSLCLSWLSASA